MSSMNRYKRRPLPVQKSFGSSSQVGASVDNKNAKTQAVDQMFAHFRAAHAHLCNRADGAGAGAGADNTCIGLLFIIIDDFPHENIWRAWLRNISQNNNSDSSCTPSSSSSLSLSSPFTESEESPRVKILIHAKYPDNVTSPWVRARLVQTFHYKPEWGSIDLTRVMIGLMKEMMVMHGTEVAKVVFASESCLPVVPLHVCLSRLLADAHSWLNYSCEADNGFTYQKQWEPVIRRGFPVDCLYKADQWCVLSHAHVVDILNCPRELYEKTTISASNASTATTNTITTNSNTMENRLLDQVFGNALATDETYISSVLRLCGHISGSGAGSSNQGSGRGTKTITAAVVEGDICSQQKIIPYCVSGVRRLTVSFVRWSREEEGAVLTGSPYIFTQLSEDLVRECRLCNHPGARLGRVGWGTAFDKDSSHTRLNNPELASLKASVHLDDYKYSTLFVRKIKVKTVQEKTRLWHDWLSLVLHHHCQQQETIASVSVSVSKIIDTCTPLLMSEVAIEGEAERTAENRKRKLGRLLDNFT